MAYTTAALIQEELRLDIPFSDETSEGSGDATVPSLSTVNNWISEVESVIDNIAQKHFESKEHTLYFDYDGINEFLLKYNPIVSITSLEYSEVPITDSNYPAWTTLQENIHYTSYNEEGRVEIFTENKTFSKGKKRFKLVYNSGYSSVPPYIQMLSTQMVSDRVLRSLMNKSVDETGEGGSIVVGSIRVMEPSQYGVKAYRELQNNIKEGKSRLIDTSGVHRYNW